MLQSCDSVVSQRCLHCANLATLRDYLEVTSVDPAWTLPDDMRQDKRVAA